MTLEPKEITKMPTEAEKLLAYGDNARLWAKAMRADAYRQGLGRLPQEWLYDWVAEAIENADHVRRARRRGYYRKRYGTEPPIGMGPGEP